MTETQLPPARNNECRPIWEDLGIATAPKTRKTIFGIVQTWSSLDRYEWVFLITSVLSFLASVGLTIERLISLQKQTDDYTFAILLLFTTVFCLYYAVDGILMEKLYEILVCWCSTIIVVMYCILNFVLGVKNVVKLVRMVVALVFGILLVSSGLKIAVHYYQSRELIYRTVGASLDLQTACQLLYLFISLLGFDLQLEGSMLIFALRNGTALDTIEKIILGVGVPFAILWVLTGMLAVRFENKPLVFLFLCAGWIAPAYVIYKFYEARLESSEILNISIFACGALSILVRIGLVVCMVFVMMNFGRGLKQKVYGSPSSTPLKLDKSYVKYTPPDTDFGAE